MHLHFFELKTFVQKYWVAYNREDGIYCCHFKPERTIIAFFSLVHCRRYILVFLLFNSTKKLFYFNAFL